MMNKKLIVGMLKASESECRYYEEKYMQSSSSSSEEDEYRRAYLSAQREHDARMCMLLAFGYTVKVDKSDRIIGITKTK